MYLLKSADTPFSDVSVCVTLRWHIVIVMSWGATRKTRLFSFNKLEMQNPN